MGLRWRITALAAASTAFCIEALVSSAEEPDYWSVSGIEPGASLNIRASASTGSEVILQLGTGTVLKNLGCLPSGLWCRVQSPDGITVNGWAARRFLTEAGAPPPADALVAGTSYNATGEIRCTLDKYPETRTCKFGVIRSPGSRATIFVVLPTGEQRVIEFEAGEPKAPAGVPLVATRAGDTTVVDLYAGTEIYEIIDVIYLGD